ncbi:hypothetical protein MKUB_37320 [Mycobacterium kubicae]|uniref:YbjN domain-containing protein n=2 Tax=Mycobacterium kubicae TaxID=120959 RepID=A0ABQ1BRG4_9MYCO|nr:hypothetical protein [Mycobacterium kubicae]GFG66242.1 hypothetical protein MKUB_37320 [Mycobacterium kubicae]
MSNMTEPMGEPLTTELIERYLHSRGRRYFRGQHDGEFFFVVNCGRPRMHVHLGIPGPHSDTLTLRATPASFYPVADAGTLSNRVAEWNKHNGELAAVVHGSSDPQRIGVTVSASHWVGERVRFEDFGEFVDRALGAAVELFSGLAPSDELPTQSLLQAG